MALGKSSRAVSLPKSWLRMNGVDRGDRVSLLIHGDGSLIVYPSVKVEEEKSEIHLPIDANESEDSIIRRIIGSYLDGYTIIKLTSGKIFSVDQQRAIRQVISSLYMMIVESDAHSIMLQTRARKKMGI